MQTTLTQADGSYQFDSLPAGNYTIVETQPQQYLSGGKDTAGNLGGQASTNDVISQIVLAAGQKGTEYNFGEYLLAPGYLSKRLALASTPTTASAVAARRVQAAGGFDGGGRSGAAPVASPSVVDHVLKSVNQWLGR